MKILRLDLRAFGPFTDVSLDLSGGSEGLHLVYGPNEAGKSSSLRALGQMLYGIPANSADNFIHRHDKMRVGAVLARRDGTRLEMLRRKGLKNTLLAADDQTPIDESQLAAFLGGCDQGQFDTMFGIGHPSLVAGGQDIIRGHGEVGHVLFAAGAGIADLRAIQDNLEKEAAALFKAGGSKPAVNQALAALKDARHRIRESQLPSAEWVKHRKALDEAAERLTQIETAHQGALRDKSRLERIGAAVPVIARRKQLAERLTALGDVPALSADFAEQRRDNLAELTVAQKAEQTAQETLGRLEQQIAAIAVPDNLLARAKEIEDLYRAASVHRKAQADLPGLVAKREQAEKEAAAILQELRPDLPLEAAGELRVTRRQQVAIQNLANRHEALAAQLRQAREEIAATKRRLADAQSQLAELPEPRDPATLKAAIRQIQAMETLQQQAADLRAELGQLDRQAQVELKKLGPWSGTLDELESLAPPAVETVDRFDRQWADAQSAVARWRDGLEKARGAQADLDRQIEQLRLEGEVPTEDDLAAARRVRDEGWRLVLTEWRQAGAEPDAMAEFLSHFQPGAGLADAYEQAVRKADDLADRLRREANRVATRATLQANRLASEQQLAAIAGQLAEADAACRRIEEEWLDCWRPARVEPLPPREMRPWLQRQQALLERLQSIHGRSAVLQQISDRMAAERVELETALAEVGLAPEDSLSKLLQRCETALAEIEAAAENRRQLARDVKKFNEALADAQARAERAEAELAEWHAQWSAAVERLSLEGDAAPAVVNEVLARTAELFERLKQAEGFAERIREIDVDAQRFREEVDRVARQVDLPPPTAGSHEQAAEEMSKRLRGAVAEQKNLALLETQRAEHREKLEHARRTIDQAAARLRAMCQEARCDAVEALPAVEQASREAAVLRTQWDACNADLLRLSAGATIESLLSEAEAVEPDELPAKLQQLADRIAELERERGALRETIGGEKAVLATMDAGSAAAEAAEDLQDLLARIEPDVRQYVRLRLASAVLRDGIERYRKKNEGPVLGRASELFRRLTLGSFEGLQIDFDAKGEQVLAGIRAGGERLLPDWMSDGTADQLYLALRLASLETWLARNEPIPFIVDDILIGFDNDRAAATLAALAELSRHTQVIFFTHHEHLLALAGGCVAEGDLFVHRLQR